MRITKIYTLIIFLLPLYFFGCKQTKEHDNQHQNNNTCFAEGFTLSMGSDDVFLIEGVDDEVIVFDKDGEDALCIDRSSHRYVCLSSTHIAFLASLGETENIVGAPDSSYIFNEPVKKMIREGSVKIVSNGAGLNHELIIDLQPSVIFTDRMRANEMTLFQQQGIPVVYIEEYREISPLARTEWLRVFGRVADKAALADSLFLSIKDDYEQLAVRVKENVLSRPTIFGGMEYQGVWYVSGAKSYIAEFYKDAGANYLFGDNDKSASIPLDFEVVYDKGSEADFWRIVYGSPDAVNYDHLVSWNIHYQDFQAFKNKSVIFCNPLESPYYEQGVVEPQIILSDMVYAMHPELMTNYNPKYYYLLK